MKTKSCVTMTILLLAATPALAHDLWLQPRTALAVDGKPTIFDLTIGTAYPELEAVVKGARVVSSGWRTAGASGGFDSRSEESRSLAMEASPTGGGTAVAFVSLRPNEIDLTPEQVVHHFDEIGASEALRSSWDNEADGAKFHETYTMHAKTFVRMDSAEEDPTCRRPVGLALELIPQRDPTALKVGDELVVKAVRGGDDEVESFAVGAVCGKTGNTDMRRTNQNGMVTFTINDSGWWMVRATEVRRRGDGTYESDFTTMTFYVEE